MKKRKHVMKFLALMMVATLLLGITAFAAEAVDQYGTPGENARVLPETSTETVTTEVETTEISTEVATMEIETTEIETTEVKTEIASAYSANGSIDEDVDSLKSRS